MNISDLPYAYFQQRPLRSQFTRSQSIEAPPGSDDCSIITLPGKLLVTTTDFVNSRPALLTLNVGTLEDLGYLAITANLSDLIGSGAKPVGCLLGVQLGEHHTAQDFEKIMNGANRCLQEYNVALLGGDTKKGDNLSIYGVGIGAADSSRELLLANRARPGDRILLSGPVGGFNAAVYALTQGQVSSTLRDRCIAAIVRPTLSLEVSRRIANTQQSRAGIDISDGLGADIATLASLSDVGVRVSAATIPLSELAIAVGAEFNLNPLLFAFATGGDFQFIATGEHVNGTYDIGVISHKSKGLVLEYEDRTYEWPTKGHDDALMQTFSEEVASLIGSLSL